MKLLKEKVNVSLDGDMVEKIKELAEEQDRSFSSYINLVLKNHLKQLEKRNDKN